MIHWAIHPCDTTILCLDFILYVSRIPLYMWEKFKSYGGEIVFVFKVFGMIIQGVITWETAQWIEFFQSAAMKIGRTWGNNNLAWLFYKKNVFPSFLRFPPQSLIREEKICAKEERRSYAFSKFITINCQLLIYSCEEQGKCVCIAQCQLENKKPVISLFINSSLVLAISPQYRVNYDLCYLF